MRKEDLLYIAGFIDGEGCISLRKNGPSITPVVQVSQTKKQILVWIKNKLKVGRIYVRPAYNNSNTAYILNIFSNEARIILPKLLPYLKVKHKQTELVLEFFHIVDTVNHKQRKERLTKLLNKVQKLNGRGR